LAVIKLTLLATVEVEILFDPTTVYFRDMNKGEERNQRVHIKNTSKNTLHISSINPDDDMVKVDLINRTPDWPLELKQDESLDLLVNFLYQQEKPRFSKQIKINYKGGEGNVAHLRVYATQKPKPKKPQEQTKPLPKDVNQQKDAKPLSVETSPSKEVFPMPPPPPDMPPKEERNKPKEKTLE
jgi:hypothetical protein